MEPEKQFLPKPKKHKLFTIVIVILIGVVVLAGIVGGIFYLQKKKTGISDLTKTPDLIEIPTTAVAKRLVKPEDIVSKEINVTPKIPPYRLPLKIKDISNYQKFSEKIKLSSRALSLLRKNGFVVIPTPKDFVYEPNEPDDFVEFYSALESRDIPIFITTDSLLHYYHIFFDATLMRLERDLFYDNLWQMSKEFLDDALLEYKNAPSKDLKEAAKRNVAYFSVGLELLRPKKNQLINDDLLKKEYCFPGMDPEYCEKSIKELKKRYGDKASLRYFNKEEFKKYSFEIPDFVKNIVQKEIDLIEKHQGWQFSPIFIYKEDYSQYVPRGHYTKSEKLKNYFKAMMWYGRMTALIKGSPTLPKGKSMCTGSMDGIISEYDAKIQTLQASLITKKFLETKEIQEKWQKIYVITSYFVGFSDDLGPYEYSTVLKSLFEKGLTSQNLEEKYPEIKNALLDFPHDPKIYSGLGACELLTACPPLTDEEIQKLKDQAKKVLKATKGFRLMGQRFTIDSWLFSELVSPYSGEYTGKKLPLPTKEKPFTFSWDDPYPDYRNNRPFTWVKADIKECPPPAEREIRGFPRGLDIMALLGSKRAKEILKELKDTEYSDYERKFSELKATLDSLPQDEWFQNLYWNWLYVLKSLFTEFGKGYQTFMQTKAWQDKELNTALASWAELRHDTILYVKQSYTMPAAGAILQPIVGYVEPVPEFYARLLTLTEMTNKGLKGLLSKEEFEKLKIETALKRFSAVLETLIEISKKELENKPLTEREYEFIRGFGAVSKYVVEDATGGEIEPDIFKTTLIADVFTEGGNTQRVLEEGVGYVKALVVAYKLPQGHILLGVGPVFSYYEFKQPMKDRLTDEAWRKMLKTTKHPSEPEWTKSFSE